MERGVVTLSEITPCSRMGGHAQYREGVVSDYIMASTVWCNEKQLKCRKNSSEFGCCQLPTDNVNTAGLASMGIRTVRMDWVSAIPVRGGCSFRTHLGNQRF